MAKRKSRKAIAALSNCSGNCETCDSFVSDGTMYRCAAAGVFQVRTCIPAILRAKTIDALLQTA